MGEDSGEMERKVESVNVHLTQRARESFDRYLLCRRKGDKAMANLNLAGYLSIAHILSAPRKEDETFGF